MKTQGMLLAIALFAGAAHAQDVTGAITIKKRLTKRNVTAPVSIYQRGAVVSLGKDSGQDPLAYELAHVVVYLEGPAAGGRAPGAKARKAAGHLHGATRPQILSRHSGGSRRRDGLIPQYGPDLPQRLLALQAEEL